MERQEAAGRRLPRGRAGRGGAAGGRGAGAAVHGWVRGRGVLGVGGWGLGTAGLQVAAGGGHKKECPAPCSGPAAPTPHPCPCVWACSLARVLLPWAWLAEPWVRGGGPHVAGLAVAGQQWARSEGNVKPWRAAQP